MILLTEDECRALIAHPAITTSQWARWFYEDAPKIPELPDHAFRRVLSVAPMTERTRLRISNSVRKHLTLFAAAHALVTSDEGEQFL